MANPLPEFFFVVSQSEMMAIMEQGEIPVGEWGYIGLRELQADALTRYTLRDRTRPADRLFPALLARIIFTEEALLRHLTTCVGANGQFRPWLAKNNFWDGHDWKCWHCQVPIPVHQPAIAEVSWTELPGIM